MENAALETLLLEMDLEEKINQLLQVSGDFYLSNVTLTGPIKEQGFTEKNAREAGSVIGVFGAQKAKGIQKAYMEKNPQHIPLLFTMDVINGFKTVFPIPLAQGATFEPELAKRCAAVAAKESAVSGIHVTFAPMVDLVRDPRWGRVMESTGEDTYLNCQFAKAMVEGFQGSHISEPYKVAACVKHFAGYGAAVAGRDYNTVELSEHTFRQFYLPAYRAGIEAGSELVMTSFNTINGIPASGNKHLMRDILRDEMKFDGILISDYAAIEELIAHGYAKDKKEAAKASIEAGVDIDMMTNVYVTQLKELVESNIISENLINEAVMRILKLKNKLGLFENPFKDADENKEKEIVLCTEHRKIAREASAKSFVLLKNDQILPLKKENQKIAFIGPYVDEQNIYGSWSFIGDSKDAVSIMDGAKEYFHEENIVFEKGCPILDHETMMKELEQSDHTDEEEILNWEKRALAAAEAAEVVVMAIGEHRLQSGEASCRAEISIPKVQMELFRKVYDKNKNIVAVLFNGRPLDIRELDEKAAAILEVWFPGTEGGHAIIDVLTGQHNPSGKLPMSFPYSVGQIPIHYNSYATGRPHVPGKDKDRFKSKYLDIPNNPLYPFGYGLSYTSFIYTNMTLDKKSMGKEDTITATVSLENTGEYEGAEVVQLYMQDVAASVVRPTKELKGFQKVIVKPGEKKLVSFDITEDMLRFYRKDMSFGSEFGEFRVYIGADSMTQDMAEFTYHE